jgi:hypothetical protein
MSVVDALTGPTGTTRQHHDEEVRDALAWVDQGKARGKVLITLE